MGPPELVTPGAERSFLLVRLSPLPVPLEYSVGGLTSGFGCGHGVRPGTIAGVLHPRLRDRPRTSAPAHRRSRAWPSPTRSGSRCNRATTARCPSGPVRSASGPMALRLRADTGQPNPIGDAPQPTPTVRDSQAGTSQSSLRSAPRPSSRAAPRRRPPDYERPRGLGPLGPPATGYDCGCDSVGSPGRHEESTDCACVVRTPDCQRRAIEVLPRDHPGDRTTERVYRHELRPVLRTGAERMGRIFSQRS